MEPLAEEHGANGGSGGAPKLSLEILSHLKRAQMQNGLRHEDYQRYRQYCARRLARIRRNRDVKFSRKCFLRRSWSFVAIEPCADGECVVKMLGQGAGLRIARSIQRIARMNCFFTFP